MFWKNTPINSLTVPTWQSKDKFSRPVHIKSGKCCGETNGRQTRAQYPRGLILIVWHSISGCFHTGFMSSWEQFAWFTLSVIALTAAERTELRHGLNTVRFKSVVKWGSRIMCNVNSKHSIWLYFQSNKTNKQAFLLITGNHNGTPIFSITIVNYTHTH